MPEDSRQLARDAADSLEAAAKDRPAPRILAGFDGFVDTLMHVVDRRHGFARDDYQPIQTIPAFAARAAAASGRSTNMELVELEERPGGNAPLLARALGVLGARIAFVGAVEGERDELLPLYGPWRNACETVVPICAPGRTLAMEFDDGKLMFNIAQPVQDATWQRLLDRLGLERLDGLIADANWLCLTNWSLLGGMQEILDRIAERLAQHKGARRVFIDISDPAKRTDGDIRGLLATLERIDRAAPLTLGVNVPEAERLLAVRAGDAPSGRAPADIAPRLRDRLDVDAIAVHGHAAAAVATRAGESASTATPYTSRPRLSTGAGDHFNAGYVLARSLGCSAAHALSAGVAGAGHYVRRAAPPDLPALLDMLRRFPTDHAS